MIRTGLEFGFQIQNGSSPVLDGSTLEIGHDLSILAPVEAIQSGSE